MDFTGLRVGIIGTGSSAIQAIPVIAEQAADLTVFQRTPNFSHPLAQRSDGGELRAGSGRTITPSAALRRATTRNGILAYPNDFSALSVSPEERQRIYEERWASGGTTFMAAFNDLIFNQAANDTAAEFVRGKIREIVKDPRTAELLAPKDHPIGTKRICVDTRYFETYNRPNVHLVDVRSAPIEEITPDRSAHRAEASYEFDAIVFATGFDAMTGALTAIDIHSTDGSTLKQKWEDGPRTYLGLMCAHFPNMFMVTGPGSPSVLSNMHVSIEQDVNWITDCLAYLRDHRVSADRGNPGGRGQLGAAWDRGGEQDALSEGGVLVHGRQYRGQAAGVHALYRRRERVPQKCAEIAANGYTGFRLSPERSVARAAE